jgi:AcrR family transcriptional regulator
LHVFLGPERLDGYPGGITGGSAKKKRSRTDRPLLRAEVVEHHQRERILNGAAEAIASRGYRQTSVADIVRAAAIARARFYEHFSSKQDCFLALYRRTGDEVLALLADACAEQEQFPARVTAALSALLDYIEASPEIANAFLIAGPALGNPISTDFESFLADVAALLRHGRDDSPTPELAETVEETIVGGLYWLLYYAVLENRPAHVSELLPQLAEFSLIPFLGTEAARAAIP